MGNKAPALPGLCVWRVINFLHFNGTLRTAATSLTRPPAGILSFHFGLKPVNRRPSQLAFAVLLYVLLGVAIASYWPGLNGGLILDDFDNLAPLADLGANVTTLRDVLTTNRSGTFGRSVAMLSFAFDQIAHGGEIWFFKYTNLLLHALCGTLIFWLTARLVQGHALSRYRWWLATWVTAMWLLTPLQVSTVLYVVQRMTQLAALFTFAGLLSYVIGRQLLDQDRRIGYGLILSAFVLWWPLATLSKENGALLPLLTLLIELVFFRFALQARDKRVLVGIYVLSLLLPLTAGIVLLVVDPSFALNGYAVRDFSLTERLLTQPRILFDYIRQLTLPDGSSLGVYHDDYQKSLGLLSPPSTLLALASWIAVLVVAIFMRRKPAATMFFGVLFFLAGHMLESTILPLELYFEHRNYLPSYGLFLTLGFALFFFIQKLPAKGVVILFGALLPVSHAAATYQRVQTWTSFEKIMHSALQSHPNSARVHADLSIYYMNRGAFDQAQSHLGAVETHDPMAKPAVAIQRIVAHCKARKEIPQASYSSLESALSFSKSNYTTASLKILDGLIEKGQCPQLDVDRFTKIFRQLLLATDPDKLPRRQKEAYWLMNVYLAQLLGHDGKYLEAIRYLDLAANADKARLEPDLIKFRFQMEMGKVGAAKQTLLQLKQRDRGDRTDLTAAIRDYDAFLNETGQNNQRGRAAIPEKIGHH